MKRSGDVVCVWCGMSKGFVVYTGRTCPAQRKIEELVIQDLEREGIK